MPTKTFPWLSGIVAALLGAFALAWPPLVSVLALDPDAAEEGSDTATFLVVRTALQIAGGDCTQTTVTGF